MTYELDFRPAARREWNKLQPDLRQQLKRKLAERLHAPRVQADALSHMRDCYKIKLRSAGYRLIYHVVDEQIVVVVIAIGKREGGAIFDVAARRLRERR